MEANIKTFIACDVSPCSLINSRTFRRNVLPLPSRSNSYQAKLTAFTCSSLGLLSKLGLIACSAYCHVEGCDYRRGLDWGLDILTTYMSALYSSLSHTD
jgi:hypothetical protein